jgi:hypothetical protein
VLKLDVLPVLALQQEVLKLDVVALQQEVLKLDVREVCLCH